MRMARKCLALMALLGLSSVGSGVHAADLAIGQNYLGKINSVMPGFYGQVGVTLDGGTTCNGHPMVLLLTTNPKYKEILAALLLAQTSGQNAHLAVPRNNLSSSGTPQFCAISEAAIGANPYW